MILERWESAPERSMLVGVQKRQRFRWCQKKVLTH